MSLPRNVPATEGLTQENRQELLLFLVVLFVYSFKRFSCFFALFLFRGSPPRTSFSLFLFAFLHFFKCCHLPRCDGGSPPGASFCLFVIFYFLVFCLCLLLFSWLFPSSNVVTCHDVTEEALQERVPWAASTMATPAHHSLKISILCQYFLFHWK